MKIEFDEATIKKAWNEFHKTRPYTGEYDVERFFARYYAAEANKQLEAAQAQLEKEQKPVFEVGKTYRTRDGGMAEVTKISPGDEFPIKGKINGVLRSTWWSSGALLHNDTHRPFDLLPGAFEDEQTDREPSESHWQTRAEKAEAVLERLRAWCEYELKDTEGLMSYQGAIKGALEAAGFRIVPAQPLTVVRDE